MQETTNILLFWRERGTYIITHPESIRNGHGIMRTDNDPDAARLMTVLVSNKNQGDFPGKPAAVHKNDVPQFSSVTCPKYIGKISGR
jgi:hypothetical protein